MEANFYEREDIQEAYRAIGKWQASLENARESEIRKAIYKMMDTDEYKEAIANDDQVKIGELMARARAQGENAYMESEGYQLQRDTNLQLIKNIQEDTALKEEYYNTGALMGEQFSKGLLSTVQFDPMQAINRTISTSGTESGYAYGLNRVPYDNFLVRLHEGEKVLTASEARQQKNTPTINITGNSFAVREEADIDKVAQAIFDKVIRAQMVS